MSNPYVVHTGAPPERDLSVERAALGADIPLYQRGPCRTPQEVVAALGDAPVALCSREPYTREVFAAAPHLKGVIRYGIGVDTIDLEAATDHGVIVANFPDFCIREVANHALALLLASAKKITRLNRGMRTRGWNCRSINSPMGQIHGQTLGLVAYGHIARALAVRAQALEMNLVAYDPFVEPEAMRADGVEPAETLEELASRSDYVSCHLPLNSHTQAMLDRAFFRAMKPSAYFINTSRGAVVNEADLIAALQAEEIAGAGLDVFESEPIGPEHPFCQMDNVVLTPHTASFADDTFAALYRRVGETARVLLDGGVPRFVANAEVLARLKA